jgi:cobaltochelatase CobN
MKHKTKRIIAWGALAIVLIGTAAWSWSRWLAPTRIAFINYQVITLGEISKANDNPFIHIEELTADRLDDIDSYDMVFMNGMGLRLTEEQRSQIEVAALCGLPMMTTAATNPANRIVSLDSIAADTVAQYLSAGGRGNYRSLLNYVRRHIDGKRVSLGTIAPVQERASSLLYHADPKDPKAEELGFNTIEEYEDFLRRNNLWNEAAPRIIVTGQMGDATDLVRRLEESGNVVYPARNAKALIEAVCGEAMTEAMRHDATDSGKHFAAMIYMAHGRLGDDIVAWLTREDIPLFAPLNVNRLTEEWEEDKNGMSGGFMSQSIVTPEIDGALRSYALFAHRLNDEGLQEVYAMPERLETFVNTVNNYVRLAHKSNSEKRVAIVYFKGPGQNALTAGGLEVAPSLFNLLQRMKQEGYNVQGLPASAEELSQLIQQQGAVFNPYAVGAYDEFIRTQHPEMISRKEFDQWFSQMNHQSVEQSDLYRQVEQLYGAFPGSYMSTEEGELAVARIRLGNVTLLPQSLAGIGDNTFQIAHGTEAAPPYPYIATYLWARYGFQADVLIHFGTHGSLEYTPRKQVALSNNDWSDQLIGDLPHLYVYTIGNVGEALIAKRRTYAGIQSHLTPPFMESNVRGTYQTLNDALKRYNQYLEGLPEGSSSPELTAAALQVKRLTVELGMHRELGLDSILSQPYNADEIARIESFAEELASEKITGQLYTLGTPYEAERITSSVYAMATDPIAYGMLALDKLRGRASVDTERHATRFNARYREPAKALVTRLLAQPELATDEWICQTAGITMEQLTEAREIERSRRAPQSMMAMMMAMAAQMQQQQPAEAAQPDSAEGKPSDAEMAKMKEMGKGMDMKKALQMARMMGASPEALRKMAAKMGGGVSSKGDGVSDMMQQMASARKEYSKEQVNFALAVTEVERTLKNVGRYREALLNSPEAELASLIHAMNGGFIVPSAGGDPIANPNALPTGRNLYGINAENTPSEAAWEKGKMLAENTIKMYRERHNDSIPRKVSYTLWSSEFIETEGATIAQVLYMLGVEPIRDAFGRVTDLRLIPSETLGRPRIDVVVQTSGQLRDLAASRLFLINRAVEMAAAAEGDAYENQVAAGVVASERLLTERGISPKEAREMSTFRVFGGVNGGYGTGIQGMVQAGDRWEQEQEIADTYLNNMGAFYGSEKDWEQYSKVAFEAALTRTDAVIQPRQSNTWGALSLDHVYEFMGGMNLAVRNVTGKDPDAYFSDYRNRNNNRMQDLKEAIGVESRTTIFNPTYIREKMKGGAADASTFAEVVQNTYGWNVMKPQAVDQEMWNKIYDVYVKDEYQLGVQDFFEQQNPAALEEMTAVMLETVRKGMWHASEAQVRDIVDLHTELVNKYKPSCSGFVCDNAKLRDFIASKSEAATAQQYQANIRDIRENSVDAKQGMVLKKEDLSPAADAQTTLVSGVVVVGIVVIAIVILLLIVRRRRKALREN